MRRVAASLLIGAAVSSGLALGACQKSDTPPPSHDGAPPASCVYKNVGGRALTLAMDYPPDWAAGDRRPAMVFFFGGGWNREYVEQFEPQARYFAQRGMVCARADYRISDQDDAAYQAVLDAIAAMGWVRAHASSLGIDPERIVAAGGSAGGLLAACTFFYAAEGDTAQSHRPNALLLLNPKLTAIGKGAEHLDEATRDRISPARLARETKDMVPALLVVGSLDLHTLALARRFAHDVEGRGAEVEIEVVAGQRHGFFNYMPWLASTTERADTFFQSIGYLKPEPKVPLPAQDALEKPGDRDRD